MSDSSDDRDEPVVPDEDRPDAPVRRQRRTADVASAPAAQPRDDGHDTSA